MPGMIWVGQVQKKPSQLVLVPSMAISQQYLMPSFWFLGRAALHKNCCLCLVRCWRWCWPAGGERRSRGIDELARGVAGW